MTRAVVLLSGGLDSATCLWWALREGRQVTTLTVDYGQRHGMEVGRADALVAEACRAFPNVREVEDLLLDLPSLSEIGGSALTDPLGRGLRTTGVEPGIPSSYVPARNTIWIGVNAVDYCVAGGTRIGMPCDRRRYPDGVPVEDLVGKQPLVYAYDPVQGRIVLRRAYRVAATGRVEEVVRVSYEWKGRGKSASFVRQDSLVCTPDHRLMLRDGSYCRADELESGDRLMPFNCTPGPKGRHMVSLNNGGQMFESRFAWSEIHGPVPAGHEVHHCDEDRFNNDPSNLEAILRTPHRRAHTAAKNPAQTDQARAIISAKKFAYWERLRADPEALRQRNENVSAGRRRLEENHKVTGVERLAEPVATYNLGVDEVRNFAANGVIIANSGYPDCRPEFLMAFEQLTNVATRRAVEGRKLVVRAPLLDQSKWMIVRKAVELGVPLEWTWSCYDPAWREGASDVLTGWEACGVCDSCRIRLAAFERAGLPDPVPYRPSPTIRT